MPYWSEGPAPRRIMPAALRPHISSVEGQPLDAARVAEGVPTAAVAARFEISDGPLVRAAAFGWALGALF